jgi:hypothetical protein
MVGTPASRRCSSLSSVLQPLVSARLMVSAQAHCQRRPHGRCAGPSSVLWLMVSARPIASARPWSVLRPMVSARPMVGVPAYCWCSSAWSVLRRLVSAQRLVGAPAHGRCPHRKPRTGAQHHVRLGPTRACSRLGTSSAPASLHLFPAADAWR